MKRETMSGGGAPRAGAWMRAELGGLIYRHATACGFCMLTASIAALLAVNLALQLATPPIGIVALLVVPAIGAACVGLLGASLVIAPRPSVFAGRDCELWRKENKRERNGR